MEILHLVMNPTEKEFHRLEEPVFWIAACGSTFTQNDENHGGFWNPKRFLEHESSARPLCLKCLEYVPMFTLMNASL